MMQIRTIFLMVRGVDRTGAMFRSLDKNTRKLISRQLEMQRVFTNILFVGAAFTTFATFLGLAFGKIIEYSSMGSLYIEDFRRVIEKLGIKISEVAIKHFGPFIEKVLKWLDDLATKQSPLIDFIVYMGFIGTMALAIIGPLALLVGSTGSLVTNLYAAHIWLKNVGIAGITLEHGMWSLALAIGAVVGGFFLGKWIGDWLINVAGVAPELVTLVGVLLAIAAAIALIKAIMTSGLSLITDLPLLAAAGIGLGMAYAGMQAGAFQGGGIGKERRGVSPPWEGGELSEEEFRKLYPEEYFAWLEEVEAEAAKVPIEPIEPGYGGVYEEGLLAPEPVTVEVPEQVINEYSIEITQIMENVNTKADKEEMEEYMKETWGKILDETQP